MTEENTIEISQDGMTIQDIMDIEEISGKTMAEITPKEGDDGSSVDAKTLLALVFVSERRNNPDFTLEDAKKIKVESISGGEGVKDSVEDPS